jgi:murein L,D-transpeptidase YcbB/YkuD
VPVFLTYLTAIPTAGSISYLPDIYGRDRAALARVDSGLNVVSR